ncbi:MAG: hypothetical protein ACHQPH_07915 [Reyranellales bacterium]
MRHLERELLIANRLARMPEFDARLMAAGLLFPGPPLWGVTRVSTDKRFYEPDPDGQPAVIAPAYESGGLADLVAISLRGGHAMRLRRGEVAFLGSDAVLAAYDLRRPLMLFENGLSWIRNGCAGAVIVDWSRIARELAAVPAIACETARLANRVRHAFERPIPLPDLYVSQPQETRHAA